MAIALLIGLGIGVVALGSGATFLLASGVPQPVLARAQENGRYAGLSTEDSGGGPGKTIAAGFPKLGKQITNAC
jgi:hypothetical protein